jgi:large subunit ribosomal protein L4
MLEAAHFSVAADPKGNYALPVEYDGTVHETALYHAVRAYQGNQRQGTHATKTRSEVSGGSRKPWRQKGTGRARQGTIRAAHWRGGGIVFGPKPRRYRIDLPVKLKRLARQSALNARANEKALYVIEELAIEQPKTKRMVELLEKMGLQDRKVLVLTSETRSAVHLSGRNLPNVLVRRYRDASAYEVLWSDAVIIEEQAIGGHVVARSAPKAKAPRARAGSGTRGKAAGRALAKQRASATKTTKKAKKKSTKKTKPKGGSDA